MTSDSTLGRKTRILCEGYDDRSFLAGILTHRLGWTRKYVKSGMPGEYRYVSGSDELGVLPCQGNENVLMHAEKLLKGFTLGECSCMILILDSDETAIAPLIADRVLDPEWLLNHSPLQGLPLTIINGRVVHANSGCEVKLRYWESADDKNDPLPLRQTLERMITAAMRNGYPERYRAVTEWLEHRPEPTGASGKPETWSAYAGWYTEHGTGFFYEALVKDMRLWPILEKQLITCSILGPNSPFSEG